MRAWPKSLGGRLLLAFVVAAAGIAVLAVTVRQRDAVRAAERRAGAAPVEVPPLAPALGLSLAPIGGRVLLASRIEAVPPDAAPIVQVFADGSAAVRRPAPLAMSPLVLADGGDAVLLLPARSLAGLGPAARATLLDLIAQLVAVRPVPPERVHPVDVAAAGGELLPLLQWVP